MYIEMFLPFSERFSSLAFMNAATWFLITRLVDEMGPLQRKQKFLNRNEKL
jgi:hypothetical protein